MRTFVDTFSKFKEFFSSTFNNWSLNTVGIIVLFGSCGEKNIKNANLTSTEKDYLLEISPNTILQPKLYMSENNSFWISFQNKYLH